MKRTSLCDWLVAIAILLGATTIAFAQQVSSANHPKRIDLGKVEYEGKCATCHGLTGKGDGPTAQFLTRKPADLTALAKNNNGIIPMAKMYEIISGDTEVAGHGTREMPVWGKEYQMQASEFYRDMLYDPEVYVRAQILALIEYINRLQAK